MQVVNINLGITARRNRGENKVSEQANDVIIKENRERVEETNKITKPTTTDIEKKNEDAIIKLFMIRYPADIMNLKDRYIASMVLHGVGDALGYRNGKWEFLYEGKIIHEELQMLGGIENLTLDRQNWMVSDDTVLQIAVAECLGRNRSLTLDKLYLELIDHYKSAMEDMNGRAPSNTTIQSVKMLSRSSSNGYRIPFNPRGTGCGAAIRSSCIGLRYPKTTKTDFNDLIAFSIESGRMTHHHPLGYLGSYVAALFTSYAIQGKRLENWGCNMLNTLDRVKDYVIRSGHDVKQNLDNWSGFGETWLKYLKKRNIDKPDQEAVFPKSYDVEDRDQFYRWISDSRWAGSLGVDSVIIAYDALLGSKNNWNELCLRGMLHGGDNDSTGCIAGSWYGALYGFENVPVNHYLTLEYFDRLIECGQGIFEIVKKETISDINNCI